MPVAFHSQNEAGDVTQLCYQNKFIASNSKATSSCKLGKYLLRNNFFYYDIIAPGHL